MRFQSTLPRGERLSSLLYASLIPYFNPRSREGSDHPRSNNHHRTFEISIHAPARGATDKRELTDQVYRISIHAPAKGATMFSTSVSSKDSYFNPRSREGSDPVSSSFPCSLPYFNPRSREGSDQQRPEYLGGCKHFNPRSREGSDEKHHSDQRKRQKISIHAPAKGATAKTHNILVMF